MLSVSQKIETNHEDLVHDAQTNYLGTILATCGGDCKIKLFDVTEREPRHKETLSAHEGPVWCLDWSHPEYGNLLASCSFDRSVIIWKEENEHFNISYRYKEHDSSVNCVQFAPKEFGLILACASADGSISILTYNGQWESRKIQNAHTQGANAISWAPPISAVSTINRTDSETPNLSRTLIPKRFVSGGCDNTVKIWLYKEDDGAWITEHSLEQHSDWVRDVAWAPSIGLSKWYIASCSHDKKVIIWINHAGPSGSAEWETKIMNLDSVVWHVSWSVLGNMLAVSCGDNKIQLYKENMNGEFESFMDVLGDQP